MRQEKLIDETDWDLLIVLDACRYDYFKKIYPEYLEGDLKKAISPASNTMEWCQKVAETGIFKDTVCISANPHINSKTPVGNQGWDPRNKFKEIYDVWLTHWDDRMPTVRAKNMVEKTLEVECKTSDRILSWFIQPHAPFVGQFKGGTNPFPRSKSSDRPMEVGGKDTNKLKQGLQFLIETFLPLPLLKKFWEYQVNERRVDVGPERVAFARLTIKEFRRAYMENLKVALRKIPELVENVENRQVVVTADHGELLGDNKFFGKKIGHPAGYDYPELRTVPWLEVDSIA